MSDASGESYVFFLSYARADAADGFLDTFFEHLREAVRGRTGMAPERIGFRDTSDIQPGELWPDELEAALCCCRAFVSLFSPTYFAREACGKELALFHARLGAQASGPPPPLVIPVLWIPLRRQHQELPSSILRIQHSHEDFGTLYAQKGLRYLLSVGKNQEYRELVESFADKLVNAVETHPLDPVHPPLRLADMPSAFDAEAGRRLPDVRSRPRAADPDTDRGFSERPERREDFLSLVETLFRHRNPKAEIERIPGKGPGGDHLRVFLPDEEFAPVYPVGAVEHGISREALRSFLRDVAEPYRRRDPGLVSMLVYGGEPAPEDLVREARTGRVRLVTFIEYQGLIDFRGYVARQTAKLAVDSNYPPNLYVPQRMTQVGGAGAGSEDALAQVREWLDTANGRFVLVLGDFGTGKTFLLHELARRMGEEGSGLIPILLQMRSLEKGRSLDALLAQHFAIEEVDDFTPRKFRHMLEQGRIALLFDGFDELALRVTYPKATEHFDTILQAAGGHAKVIVTSRRQHFLSEQQVRNALGEKVELVPGNRIALLQPFNREQIRGFLVGYCGGDERKAEARLALIEGVQDLLGLSHNPRMLSFIAELPEEQLLEAKQGKGKITAADLYRLILSRWLEGEVDRVQPKGAPPALSVEDRWTAVTALARRLWQKADPFISLAELEEDTARVLEALGPPALDADAAAFQVASGTLLVRDEEGSFSFLHQSILEWLVAREAAGQIAGGVPPDSLLCREISPLMADFLIGLCGRNRVLAWVPETGGPPSAEAARNAFLLTQRLERESELDTDTAPAGAGEAGDADLGHHDYRGFDLSGQDLSRADLEGADFTGAQLDEALLVEARLGRARLINTSLVRADLTKANLAGADLRGANLTGARLLGADLRGTHLRGAIFHRAKLLGAGLDPGDRKALESGNGYGAAIERPERIEAFVGQGGGVVSMGEAWSPDASLLAAGVGKTLRLWDVHSGREIRRFQGHQDIVWSVAFSPDGRTLVSGGRDAVIRLWDLTTGVESRCLKVSGGTVRSVIFHPDGRKILSLSGDGKASLWSVATGKEIRRFESSSKVLSVGFHPDGHSVAGGLDDGWVCLWNVATGREARRWEAHQESVNSLSFDQDGESLVTGSSDDTLGLWEAATGKELRRIASPTGRVVAVDFNPDGRRVASGSLDGAVSVWDLSRGRELHRLAASEGRALTGLRFSPDGRWLLSCAVGGDSNAVLWETSTGQELRRFQTAGNPVRDLKVGSTGRDLATVSSDGSVRLWDMATGEESLRISGSAAWAVAVSVDGQRIASGSRDGLIRIWDRTQRELRRLEGHKGGVLSLDFSPDGRHVVSGGLDSMVRLWEVATGKELRCYDKHRDSVTSVRFSPDGRRIVSGSNDRTIGVWRPAGKEPRRWPASPQGVSSVSFSQDGLLLLSGSTDGVVSIWELSSCRELRRFEGHEDDVTSACFSPNGQSLASASRDGTVRLWKISTGRELRRFEGHGGAVGSVSFSPNSRHLVSGSSDGTIRIWK
ncbi:MAG TPA: TIR-like protein FxsC, partial [Thermoanaerobaculia bacterium]|nr:TIR-like protein FxsC [Thermoanaerobaculia bacterium]